MGSWWTQSGETHQCHFKVVSCGCVVQFDLVPDLFITEMSPEVFLFLSVLNTTERRKRESTLFIIHNHTNTSAFHIIL